MQFVHDSLFAYTVTFYAGIRTAFSIAALRSFFQDPCFCIFCYSGMMLQSHQLIQKIAGFTGRNIFKQRFMVYYFPKACQKGSFIPADNVPAFSQILSFPQQFIIRFPFFSDHAAAKSCHFIGHTIDHLSDFRKILRISFKSIC